MFSSKRTIPSLFTRGLAMAALLGATASVGQTFGPVTKQKDRYACAAECLAYDHAWRSIEMLGMAFGTSEINVLEAFQVAQRECEWRIADQAPQAQATLAKAFQLYERTTHQGSSSWRRAKTPDWASPFYFTGWTYRSGWRSYYHDRELRLDIQFAQPLDQTVCRRIQGNPKGKPKYVGKERPMG